MFLDLGEVPSYCCSVASSCPVLWLHGLQQTRSPCPSPYPRVFPSSCSLHRWCHLAISSSDALFSFCPWCFPASGTFTTSHLVVSVLVIRWPKPGSFSFSISPSCEYSGLISLKINLFDLLDVQGLSGVFSSIIVQRYQSFDILPSLRSSSHNCIDCWEYHSLDDMDLC